MRRISLLLLLFLCACAPDDGNGNKAKTNEQTAAPAHTAAMSKEEPVKTIDAAKDAIQAVNAGAAEHAVEQTTDAANLAALPARANLAPDAAAKSEAHKAGDETAGKKTDATGNAAPEALRPAADAPTAAQLAHADRMLAYHNNIQARLAKGQPADFLMANTRIYAEHFQLPKRPKIPRKSDLAPPEGLFNGAEAKAVTQALGEMDRAFGRMLSRYGQLEKYIDDASIRDDGKKGRELVKDISSAHAEYIAARKSWLETVQKAARQAETTLLHDHPLRRQILAAQNIFQQYGEVADLLSSGADAGPMLHSCVQNLQNLLADAGKPPFLAKPALERAYRDFLRQVAVYVAMLERGMAEGLHNAQRREINEAAENSRAAYNIFVADVNKNGT